MGQGLDKRKFVAPEMRCGGYGPNLASHCGRSVPISLASATWDIPIDVF